MFTHLLVDEASPEAGGGTGEGVGGEERRAIEGLINILNNDKRLAYRRPVAMEEHGDLLVDGVVLQQQLAFVCEVLLDELVGDSLQKEGHLRAVDHRGCRRRR